MPGPAQNDAATASGRKDAVRKAFNQEYLATQKAMSQAAERARAQVLDQRYTIASHAEDVKAGTKAPQPPVGHGQPNRPAQPNAQPHQGAPQMASDPNLSGDQQIMFDIANEIRNIITREIDLRMQILSEKVETALANAFPTDAQDPTPPATAPKRNARTPKARGSNAKR